MLESYGQPTVATATNTRGKTPIGEEMVIESAELVSITAAGLIQQLGGSTSVSPLERAVNVLHQKGN